MILLSNHGATGPTTRTLDTVLLSSFCMVFLKEAETFTVSCDAGCIHDAGVNVGTQAQSSSGGAWLLLYGADDGCWVVINKHGAWSFSS